MNGDFLCLVGTVPRRRRRDCALFPLRALLSPPILLPAPEIHAAAEAPLRLRLQFRLRRALPQRRRRANAPALSRSGAGALGGAADGVLHDGGTGSGDYDARAQLLGLSQSLSPFHDQFFDAKGRQ